MVTRGLNLIDKDVSSWEPILTEAITRKVELSELGFKETLSEDVADQRKGYQLITEKGATG
jgi:hypothetical protein